MQVESSEAMWLTESELAAAGVDAKNALPEDGKRVAGLVKAKQLAEQRQKEEKQVAV